MEDDRVSLPDAVRRLADHLVTTSPGDVLACYLFGSVVAGGLRPASDLDVLVITRRSLTSAERSDLTSYLLRYSGQRATQTPGRPLEVTSLVLADVVPWVYPPVCDFLYGEWLRDEVVDHPPQRFVNPDLAIVATTVLQHAEVLHGPRPEALLHAVPATDLRRAMHDSVPALLADLEGDERNVLLTLARMVHTLETGDIVAKDVAVARIRPGLDESSRQVLTTAAAAYRGELVDDWTGRAAQVRATADHLEARISRFRR